MAGVASITCAPWCLSLLTVLFVAVLGRQLAPSPAVFERVQVALTWLVVLSQLFSSVLSLVFARVAAERGHDRVLPNLIGTVAAACAASAVLACGASPWFAAESLAFKVVLGSAFVAFCQTGVVVSALSSLRAQRVLWLSAAFGYVITFVAWRVLARFGDTGLIAGFAIGQACTSFGALGALYRRTPAPHAVELGLARRGLNALALGFIGFVISAGLFIDKLLFWSNPATSRAVLGPWRASSVYDLPLFLAYLSMLPGMFVLLLRIEGEFASQHTAFAAAVSGGSSLRRIEGLHVELTHAARRALADIARIQAFTWLVCSLLAPTLFRASGISELHLPLFYVGVTAVALQVLALAVVSLCLYLEQRRAAGWLSLLLLVSNAGLTHATQRLGPELYGLGFAFALALTCLVGLIVLGRAFPSLVQDSFMLRPVEP